MTTAGGLDEQKAAEAESLDAKTTYEVVRREGKQGLDRSSSALFWSGLAAGLSMGFSFLAEGLLRTHLPDASWRPLVAKFGYSVGWCWWRTSSARSCSRSRSAGSPWSSPTCSAP